MILADVLLRPLEKFLNRGLAQSTTAQALAAGLEGRTLRLTVEGTPVDLHLAVSGGRFALMRPGQEPADAALAATPIAFARLLKRAPEDAVRSGDVSMSGDAEIAGRFQELLHYATPDLEDELARLVGDPIAHEVGSAVRAFGAWSRSAGDSVARNVSEYLQEESAILPSPAEIREAARRIDELVNDVDRAEARIRRLKERLL